MNELMNELLGHPIGAGTAATGVARRHYPVPDFDAEGGSSSYDSALADVTQVLPPPTPCPPSPLGDLPQSRVWFDWGWAHLGGGGGVCVGVGGFRFSSSSPVEPNPVAACVAHWGMCRWRVACT
jgi:hypothetical protein